MMKFVKRLNLLSIDVVVGAMVCNALFWKLPDGKSPINYLNTVVLGLSIFVIYTLDRLLDNRKPTQVPTERHLFHQHYERVLWSLVCAILVSILCLLFYLPIITILIGSLIAFVTILYLWIVSKLQVNSSYQYGKEFITTWVYTAGVWGTTVPHAINGCYGLFFMLIVFQNLLVFSWCEQRKFPTVYSLASFLGENKTKNVIIFIFIVLFLGSVFSLVHSTNHFQQQVAILFIIMSFILMIIPLYASFFLKKDRYRWIGDGVFLLPTLLLLIA